MKRRDLIELSKAWAKQDPVQGFNRVAMVIEVQSIDAQDDGLTHARVELDQATTLWLLRELAKMFGR